MINDRPIIEPKDINFLLITNIHLDYLTVKSLNFVWNFSKVNVLK